MQIEAKYALPAFGPEPENSQFPGSRTAISGLRYYSPSLGRFINRDPIDEAGGVNLYAFVRNNAVTHWDYLGMDEDGDIVADGGASREAGAEWVKRNSGGTVYTNIGDYFNGNMRGVQAVEVGSAAAFKPTIDRYQAVVIVDSTTQQRTAVKFNARTGEIVESVTAGAHESLEVTNGNTTKFFSAAIPAPNSGLGQTPVPGAIRSDYKGPDPASLYTGNTPYKTADAAAKASSPYLQAYQKATGLEHVSNIVQQKPDAFVYTTAYAGSGQTSSGFNPFFGNDPGKIVGFNHSHPDLSTFSYILGSGENISGDWVMGRILGNMNIYLAAPNGNTYVMPAEWFSSPRPPAETLVTVRDNDGNYVGTDIQGRRVP